MNSFRELLLKEHYWGIDVQKVNGIETVSSAEQVSPYFSCSRTTTLSPNKTPTPAHQVRNPIPSPSNATPSL
jgi:hypothetical protein